MKAKEYPIPVDINQLVNELRNFFLNADYEVQVRNESPSVIIQARKSSKIRDWTGTSYALTIKITVNQTGTEVAIGQQKWLDKAAVAVIGLIATGGFGALLGAWGAYQQNHLTEEAWNIIEKHIARQSGGSVSGPMVCPGCGATSTSSRFCPDCGTKL